MTTISAIAATAALVGEPARAGMLAALMDGRALTASELAAVAGVTPATASGHLAQLTQAGMLAVEKQGRHRYHRLASPQVAAMLESLMAIAGGLENGAAARRPRVGPRDGALRRARTCYDHLAGEIAVAIADSLVAQGRLDLSEDGAALTPDGLAFLRGVGLRLEPPAGPTRGRVFCRPCLDWSERRPHIAGAVGAALCQWCLDDGWVRRMAGTRALEVTPKGVQGMSRQFGLSL